MALCDTWDSGSICVLHPANTFSHQASTPTRQHPYRLVFTSNVWYSIPNYWNEVQAGSKLIHFFCDRRSPITYMCNPITKPLLPGLTVSGGWIQKRHQFYRIPNVPRFGVLAEQWPNCVRVNCLQGHSVLLELYLVLNAETTAASDSWNTKIWSFLWIYHCNIPVLSREYCTCSG